MWCGLSLEFLYDWEFWIAIFTLVLAGATIWLAKRTGDLIQSAEKSSERQLRAYVFVNESAITDVALGSIPKVTLQIKNSGQTPAKHLTVWGRMGISTFPKSTVPPDSANLYPSTHCLGPGGEITIIPDFNEPLTHQHLDVIQNRTHALYVVGEIKYEDAFGIQRTTTFKFYKNGKNLSEKGLKVSSDGNNFT